MRFVCPVCNQEAVHNEKLCIHYCRDHGIVTEPVLPKPQEYFIEGGLFVRQKMTR
jgi:hypothetical protein